VPRYVAFLRAINVGGHTVTMAALREHFEHVGCGVVETVIASGNVVFDTASRSASGLEKRLAAHLEARLGYPVATFLRTPEELAAVAGHAPFSRADLEASHAMYVGFLAAEADVASRRRLLALATARDAFALRGRELYWLCRSHASKISGAVVERALGQPATLRNVTTVRRIAAKYC
jgi:uncharacterized protein (DUF1697 family)